MELRITGTKETLTLQNKHHILESETRKTFETNRLLALKDYIIDYLEGEGKAVSMYYGEDSVVVWPVRAQYDLARNDVAIAKCSLDFTDELTILKNHINCDIGEKKFCEFLRKMAKYCPESMKLKDSVENMEMKKKVSMSKSKDSRGNFSYEYTVSEDGKASFTPPDKLVFKIPVFKHIDKMIAFEFEFAFSFYMQGAEETQQAHCNYRLEMLNWDQFLEQACTVLIEEEMKQFDCPKYWGELNKFQFTDEWKYKDVPLAFDGLPRDYR